MTPTGTSSYEAIKAKLLRGELGPGSPVSERELAEELGVSRVPVREALQRLVSDGLLVRGASGNLVAKTYDQHEIIDIYLYREALDGMAARLFTIRAEPMEVGLIGSLFERWASSLPSGNPDTWRGFDLNFHLTLAKGSKNARLSDAIEKVYFECFYMLGNYRHSNPEDTEEKSTTLLAGVLAEHEAIVSSIRKNDPDGAELAARRSVRNATERWVRSFTSFESSNIDPRVGKTMEHNHVR